MILIIVGAVILSGLLLLIFLHKRYAKSLDGYLTDIKGPKPNPIFGNMLDFAVPTYRFLNVIQKYLEEYGPVCKIYLGPLSSAVLIAEETLMEYVLSSQQHIEKSILYDHFHNWLGQGLLTSKGIKWKKHRRMLTPAFHFSILDNFIDVFERVGDVFVKKLEENVGKDFNIYPLVSLCTLDIICESAMGISINAQTDGDSEYVRNVKAICALLTDRNFSPLDARLYPFTINYYKEKKILNVLHSHTDAVIHKRIKEIKTAGGAVDVDESGVKKKWAFLDLLLKSTIDGKPLTRSDIREEVDTFMFEGHDTTSSAISFAIYELANHPAVQQKAIEEQKELFGDDLRNIRQVTIADLQNMKYLELVLKETLRLYPSVPFFARVTSEEFAWGNSTIPKGQQIIVFPYVIQRNEKYFPNPLEFIPERFLEIDGRHPYRYIPFSAGPRNCIGQKFAMLEMKSAISNVLRNFELLPAKTDQEMKLAPELILVSKNGIRLSLKKRL
nr:cytochrome P450 CYP4NQ25 [Monolepta hieroglyphica]